MGTRGNSFDWDIDDLLNDEENVVRDRVVQHETTGTGTTKKKAETDAARMMLILLGVL